MRIGVRRLLGVSALLFGLHLPGCSSQQQDEEGLDVSEQGNEMSEEGEYAQGQEGEESEQYNQSEEGDETDGMNENMENMEGENSTEVEGNATENDLQEIIQEMNGQQTAESDMSEMAPLQQDASAGMPANMGATQAEMPTEMPAEMPVTTNTASEPSAMPFQPGGSPVAPGLPEAGSKMSYIVEAGDTLGKISQKIYGTPGRWNELATLSGMTNPSRIYPGDLVYYTLDESAVSFATAYESLQRGTESVQPGDTLATIAQRIYGSSKAWRSLWRHNDNIDNPDILTAGTAIYYVPAGSATAAVNSIKTNIAKVSKATLENSKKASKSLVNKAKSMKISQVTSKLNVNSFASISNVLSSGLVAAI